ncbi:MAG: selenide, water dikinase SelD [Bacteroidales bacterium]|nr:selenide, water dikinase SelD [Bacteroidales bacterium]
MANDKPIYLDYNATTPIDPEVAQAMQPYLAQFFGNPSSVHQFGMETKKAVEAARQQLASLLNCQPDELIFTSGGTEANNYAIKGAAYQHRNKGNHIITTSVEHPAVTEVCQFLQTQGFQVTYVPVDETGLVDPVEIEKSITPGTILISVMHANNEVGTIQPIEEIGRIAKEHGVLFHCDAAQSVGKIETDVQKMGVDLLSVAGHKFYAPKGIGALFIRRGVQLQKLMHGASHEQNLRAGTENVLEIVGLGKAAEIAHRDFEHNTRQMSLTRDLLFERLKESLPQIKLNGHPELRLPNTLSIGFPNMEANTLLDELQGMAASAGAACHADQVDVSTVLTAMKVPLQYAMGTIRFSTGKNTTAKQVEEAAQMVLEAVKKMGLGEEEEIEQAIFTDGPVRLTQFTHGLGCACKIRPQYLEKVLQDMPAVFDKNVLVGASTSDDAAVYKISNEVAIVQTVDFFTPIVDDPYAFGAIAAANALSDIYAMGAKPLFALNIVGFPSNRLPMQVLKDILKGASDKAAEAGIPILGGHTVEDTEPKFGMVVTGQVHPEKVLTNSGALPGDVLILTKPIGTGIISTAVKRGLADEETAMAARKVMATLNAAAAKAMENFPVNACTDVTGFGLLGHLKELTEGSRVGANIFAEKVPLISGTMQLAMAGAIPGGTKNNLEFVSKLVDWSETIPEIMKLILCDAQTSGGLLISLPENLAEIFLKNLEQNQVTGTVIGKITKKGEGRIIVD